MIQKMSDSEYFAHKAISQSFLKTFRDKTAAHAKWELEHKKEATDAMILGTCLHALVLENKRVFVGLPESAKGSGKDATLLKTQYAINYPDKIILSAKDARKVERMADSVWSHKGARAILELEGESEVPIFWKVEVPDGKGGLITLEFKGKIDRSNPLGVIDLKSTCDASLREFSKSIYGFGYHIQAPHYLEGAAKNDLPCDDFIIIAVENEAPYCTALRKIDHVSIMEGEQERQELIAKYLKCVEKNHWPGYNDEIETVSIPKWGFKHIINEEY